MLQKHQSTTVSFLLDSSASMSSVHKETVEGVNDFINELKKDASETILRLQTFNSDNFNVSFDFANINEIPEMKDSNFTPEGMTPLLDSVGRAINETHKFIESNNRDHSQVIFTVMTDGIENYSTEFSIPQVTKMIAEKEELGWSFKYMGANHDVWSVANKFGIKPQNVHKYEGANPKEALMYNAKDLITMKKNWRR